MLEKNIRFKSAFTIIEVSILLVIFLIVALLVVPLSLDDTVKARCESRWRNVQTHFSNIAYAIDTQKDSENYNFAKIFDEYMNEQVKKSIQPYRITYEDGTYPLGLYRFYDYKLTHTDAVFSYKFFDEPQNDVVGILMYDVNGQVGPNKWGIDVFGYDIYNDKFEPFCKNKTVAEQKQDCNKNGKGLCCSNLILIGGNTY